MPLMNTCSRWCSACVPRKVITDFFTVTLSQACLGPCIIMPRKRSLLKTDNNKDNKVAKASPALTLETWSPYFHSDVSKTDGIQGEEPRPGTCNTKEISKEVSPATQPDPSMALSFLGQHLGQGRRLTENFFDQECVILAKALLGKVLVRVVGGQRVSAQVVETEGYLGGPDAASHSCGGKRTPRNEPMYMKPGTTYVYSIYGMYHCFNISSREEGACVLVRAAEPLEGVEVMLDGRGSRRGANAPPLKRHQLCNGPSKLCQALALTKDSTNKLDLSVSDEFWVEEMKDAETDDEAGEGGRGGSTDDKIVISTRIGIDSYGGEWAKKPLRFYVLGNKCVSVRDKQAEKNMLG